MSAATRREFLQTAAALAGATMMASESGAAPARLERRIPKTGEALPAVGLGTWQVFDVANNARELGQARETLRVFAGMGGRLIDSSPMYGSSEAVTGQFISELGLTGQLFLATKVWTSGKQAGVKQMKDSMRKLGVERLDLMQVHNLVDVQTHLATLRDWKEAGRIRYLGITHYHNGSHGELERLIKPGHIDFVQVNYSMAEPDAERRLLGVAEESRTAVIINRPFAEGAVFTRVKNRPVPEWAREAGCETWAHFFLKWTLAQPAITCVIPGTRDPRHVADNLEAMSGPLPDTAMRRRMFEYYRSL
ncbi:MAG TPA: aldo/keto reductase [Methylomirabilota bacterium]|nr:aldo/keto reductase [Methylomirabilota bacterium]